jgi:hypothetical protein
MLALTPPVYPAELSQAASRRGDSQAALPAVGNRRRNARLIALPGLASRPTAPGKASSRLARSCASTWIRVPARSLRDRHKARSARVASVSGRNGFHRCPSVRSVSASTYASNRSSLFPADPYRVRSPLTGRLGTTNTASPAASSSSTTGPSPRSIATPATPAERSRPTIARIAAASWVKLNRPVTSPPLSITQAT